MVVAETIAQMRSAFAAASPDVMILDVDLPDGDGRDALQWLRERSHVPVMMLTGHGDMVDKVVGLELGADDYLSKPFELRELLARLRTIQRRQSYAAGQPAVEINGRLKTLGLEIDTKAQEVRDQSGAQIKLTQAEYHIFVLLVRSAGRVVTRERLMEDVAGRSWDPNDRSIDVHISNLRKKLVEADGGRSNIIRTVRSAGYMLVKSVE